MAAGVHLPESPSLRSDKGLDVLSSAPARFVFRAPYISGHLHALASRPGEKCGLSTLTELLGPSLRKESSHEADTDEREEAKEPENHREVRRDE